MSTIADATIRSVFGLAVIAAMFVTIWAARDSSERSSAADEVAVSSESEMPEVHPARNHRAPVTRASQPRGQLHAR